jgi:hypothetical protein
LFGSAVDTGVHPRQQPMESSLRASHCLSLDWLSVLFLAGQSLLSILVGLSEIGLKAIQYLLYKAAK